jgi:hypothetical protein
MAEAQEHLLEKNKLNAHAASPTWKTYNQFVELCHRWGMPMSSDEFPTLSLKTWCIVGGFDRGLRILLDQGLGTEFDADTIPITPLGISVLEQEPLMMELLLSRGAQVEGKPSSSDPTPLILAAKLGSRPMATALINKGASLSAEAKLTFGNRNMDGVTAWHMAALFGHFDFMRFLEVKHNWVPDMTSSITQLVWLACIQREHGQVVMHMLYLGIDPDATHELISRTALYMAMCSNDRDLGRFLIKWGANPCLSHPEHLLGAMGEGDADFWKSLLLPSQQKWREVFPSSSSELSSSEGVESIRFN